MNDKQLTNILEVFLTVQVAKELPRQGFLYSGFKRNEADSVAAHSFSVAVFSYLMARELKKAGWKLDPDKVLKIALVHDLGETIIGDIGTYAKDFARHVFDKVEEEAFDVLMRNMHEKDELKTYFLEYQELATLEAQIVKFADALDAYVQGFNTPSADIEDLENTVSYITKHKVKNPKLATLFTKAARLISEKKVGVYKGHIGKNSERQETL